jgi:putative membrane protein
MQRFLPLALAPTVFALGLVPPPATDVDRAFVAQVSQGGMYEVAAGKIAILHAQTPDVKDLAITEVHDHQLVGAELKRIAGENGIKFDKHLNPEFEARLAKLHDAAGAGFDAAYIEDMKQIHDKDEKLFAQEANDGSDAFKTFAHQTDLIVKRHIGALHGGD